MLCLSRTWTSILTLVFPCRTARTSRQVQQSRDPYWNQRGQAHCPVQGSRQRLHTGHHGFPRLTRRPLRRSAVLPPVRCWFHGDVSEIGTGAPRVHRVKRCFKFMRQCGSPNKFPSLQKWREGFSPSGGRIGEKRLTFSINLFNRFYPFYLTDSTHSTLQILPILLYKFYSSYFTNSTIYNTIVIY